MDSWGMSAVEPGEFSCLDLLCGSSAQAPARLFQVLLEEVQFNLCFIASRR